MSEEDDGLSIAKPGSSTGFAPRRDPHGPFVAWLDYGPEGWQPHSYDSLEEMVLHGGTGGPHGEQRVLTRVVIVRITDVTRDL